MSEMNNKARSGESGSKWALRLAGPPDDSNESLWAPYARSNGYGPSEIAGILSRCRGLALPVFVAILAPAAIWIWSMQPNYEASANLMVREQGGEAASAGVIQAEVERIGSAQSLRRVAETLGLGPEAGGAEMDAAVSRLDEHVRVGSEPQSGLITIHYVSTDPELAADVVNTAANLYLDRHARVRRAAEARDSGEGDLEAFAGELQRARADLEEFRQRNRTALLPAQRTAAVNRAKQHAADLQTLDGQLRVAEAQLDALRREGSGQSGEEIGKAQTAVDGLRNRREQIVEQLRAAEGWRSRLNRLSARDAELEAALEAAERNYIEYEPERPAEAPATASLPDVSLAKRATAPVFPASRGERPLLFFLSALVAACAALAAAVIYDPTNRPVAHVADIAEASGAPVLMMIEETQSHVS